MKGLLGRKLGMTQIFNERGESEPVTVIEAGPCYVTQIRSVENDGYASIQLGFDTPKKATKLTRGERGHLGLLKTDEKHAKRRTLPAEVPALKHLRELRAKPAEGYTEGQKSDGRDIWSRRARRYYRHVKGPRFRWRRQTPRL